MKNDLVIVAPLAVLALLVVNIFARDYRIHSQKWEEKVDYNALVDEANEAWDQLRPVAASLLMLNVPAEEKRAINVYAIALLRVIRLHEAELAKKENGNKELRIARSRVWAQTHGKQSMYVPVDGQIPRDVFSLDEIESHFK